MTAIKGILIIGLRRSGTTVFWETFRRDARVTAFDEPFHPELWRGVRTNAKHTWDELGGLWDAYAESPVSGVRPIHPVDELDSTISESQFEYLRLMFDQGEQVVIDCVRIWRKLAELLKRPLPILVVHLVRHPLTWVSAHILPSGPTSWRHRLADIYRRKSFFTRNGLFNNWQYEEIIDTAISRDDSLWREIGLSAYKVKRQPAYCKLLAFWWAAVRSVESQLQSSPAIRHLTVGMEEFIASPADTFSSIYRCAGWALPAIDYSHIRPIRAAWQPNAREWAHALDWVGVPHELAQSEKLTGGLLSNCLHGHCAAPNQATG